MNSGSGIKDKKGFLKAEFAHAIETDRLMVRPLGRNDSPLLTAFTNADGRAWQQMMNWDDGADYDPSYVEETVMAHLKKVDGRNDGFRLFVLLKDRPQIVGNLLFSKDVHGRRRLGYFTLPSFRRQGYASEAYAVCLRKMDALGVPLRYEEVEPSNTASRDFLKKFGFRETGMGRTTMPDNKQLPCVIFRRKVSP